MWKKLTEQDDAGTAALGGTGADLLETAWGARARLTEEARGEAESFERVSAAHRESPQLTRIQVQWEFLEGMLSKQALTILDPRGVGRRQWIMGDFPWAAGSKVVPSQSGINESPVLNEDVPVGVDPTASSPGTGPP